MILKERVVIEGSIREAFRRSSRRNQDLAAGLELEKFQFRQSATILSNILPPAWFCHAATFESQNGHLQRRSRRHLHDDWMVSPETDTGLACSLVEIGRLRR
jgi:hypothetical protein